MAMPHTMGIPAGYESDNSWDISSNIAEATHTHSHNTVPLVALRLWTTLPNRGRGQNYRQANNITVSNGYVTGSRPWQGQPYRRRTRSQQALRAWAYRKWQRRYQVP